MTTILLEDLRRFLREDDGATAIEYSIIAVILAVTVVGSVGSIRDSLNGTFDEVGAELARNNAAASE